MKGNDELGEGLVVVESSIKPSGRESA